jgi:hypothetical protein
VKDEQKAYADKGVLGRSTEDWRGSETGER